MWASNVTKIIFLLVGARKVAPGRGRAGNLI